MDALSEIELSPLDKIRQTEAEAAGAIAAARQAAEQLLASTRAEADQFIDQARTEGKRAGQAQYADALTRAGEEAHAILVDAKRRAKKLQHKGRQRMEAGISFAVNTIIGLEEAANE